MPRLFIRMIFVVLPAMAVGAAITAQAHERDMDSTAACFHRAEAALFDGRFSDAMREYTNVLQTTRTLDLDVREWYRGNTYYGLALCAAMTFDTQGTRHFLDASLSHHFWVFPALKSSKSILDVAGKEFVDSICAFWEQERIEQCGRWQALEPVILHPRKCGPLRGRPTIVALHGGYGNLQEFARHWQDVADALCAVIVVPPGTDRPSPVGVSWDWDMAPIDSAFQRLINLPTIRTLIDPEHLYLAGFSQGGHAALSLAFRYPEIVRGAVVIDGFNTETLDSTQIARARASHTAIYGLFGERGYLPFRTSFDAFRGACDTAGIPVHLDVVAGMLHELPFDLPARMRVAIDWLDATTALRHAALRHSD